MSHSHIFNVSKRAKLNSEERRRMLTPNDTLKRLGYNEGGIFADIGCGTGLFTLPAAEIGGNQAVIYAIDISQEMLSDVAVQANEKGYSSIATILSDAYDFKLDSGTADFVLICAVLHEIDDKARFLTEARRICKSGGKLAVIDFSETDDGVGPPLHMRIKRDDAVRLLKEAGFSNIEPLDISEAYYAATGINSDLATAQSQRER